MDLDLSPERLEALAKQLQDTPPDKRPAFLAKLGISAARLSRGQEIADELVKAVVATKAAAAPAAPEGQAEERPLTLEELVKAQTVKAAERLEKGWKDALRAANPIRRAGMRRMMAAGRAGARGGVQERQSRISRAANEAYDRVRNPTKMVENKSGYGWIQDDGKAYMPRKMKGHGNLRDAQAASDRARSAAEASSLSVKGAKRAGMRTAANWARKDYNAKVNSSVRRDAGLAAITAGVGGAAMGGEAYMRRRERRRREEEQGG